MFIALGQALLVKPGPEGETTCARLFNEDSYSSVEVSVGEPPQVLRLVADTGSDNCIIKAPLLLLLSYVSRGLRMPELPRGMGQALLPRPQGVGILSRAQVQPGADG